MSLDGHVLVVDDDQDMLEVLDALLTNAGYQVRTAANGVEALGAVARAMPALVLLDMIMPVMDGWQFTQELRASYDTDVPIVVLTAAEHARSRCRGLDAADVLSKPFDAGELLRVVARYVRPSRPAVYPH